MAKFQTYYEICASFGGVQMPPLIWGESGVYCISCEANNKQYVGCSKHIMSRLKTHFYALKKGDHSNAHLQSAWNKYGPKAFYVCVLHYTDNIKDSEIHWINEFDSHRNGFNLTVGGDGVTILDEQVFKKAREKITEGIRKPEVRKKIGEWSRQFHKDNKEEMRGVLRENALRGWAKLSPEERTARALRVWETRRKNKS